MSENTAIYGIVGRNISYSLSPLIYRKLFQQHKIEAIYNRYDVAPAQLDDFLKAVRALPLAGFNVTIPYKESLGRYIDKRDRIVAATGSTNLVINRRGVLRAYNTDFEGIAATIENKLKLDLYGASIVIFGSGGAARTAFHYLVTKQVARVTVYHRSHNRERQFSAWAEQAGKRVHYRSQMINSARGMNGTNDLGINCTPVAISKLIGTAAVSQLPRVFELRYAGGKSPRRDHIGGEYMLAVQAAKNFRIMTGVEVAAEQIVRIIRRASR